MKVFRRLNRNKNLILGGRIDQVKKIQEMEVEELDFLRTPEEFKTR